MRGGGGVDGEPAQAVWGYEWVSNPVIWEWGVHDHVNRMDPYQQCQGSGRANILKVSNSKGGRGRGR